MKLLPVVENDVLRFERDDIGKPVRLSSNVDGSVFAETWLAALERADAHA